MAQVVTHSQTVVSYKIFITAQNSRSRQIGQLINLNPSERRDITPNFVIGSQVPDVADELIPGVARERTLTGDLVVFYNRQGMQVFGTDNQPVVQSILDQNTTFVIQEQITDPNTQKTKTINYIDCFVRDYSETRDMSRPDIRVLARVVIQYRDKVESAFQ